MSTLPLLRTVTEAVTLLEADVARMRSEARALHDRIALLESCLEYNNVPVPPRADAPPEATQ